MPSADEVALRDWAASGAMALTGAADGPPLAAPGDPAGTVRRALARIADLTMSRCGERPELPDERLLGERAAIAGLGRNGPWSCGGAFRAVRTADGWLGLSLARPADVEMVPALVEAVGGDPWDAVLAWAISRPTAVTVERARLLGLAASALPEAGVTASRRPPVLVDERGPRRTQREAPLVVDLTSLWAGPLCAHLLGLGGARVVKVESWSRPDGARLGPPAFFDLLHAGHAMVAFDFGSRDDLAALRELMAGADLVLEASRPRALRQLGIHAEEVVEGGTSWLSITARGRASDAIGFGDDVAAGAGLFARYGDAPVPCGDALADPLAGVVAAEAAVEALCESRARLIDVSMHDVAAAAAAGGTTAHDVARTVDGWRVATASSAFPVAAPEARTASHAAGALGADNRRVLG